MINCNEIQDYINLVRSGMVEVCKEQILMVDYVEKIFKSENLTINAAQLAEYMDLQKYFPFELFEWEKFCFTLHNCVYKENGQLRWPVLFIMVGRGAGKNGYLAFEDFCLLTPVNGVKYYFIDIFATSEDQAKTTFEDVYNILEDNPKLKTHFYWTKEVIVNLKTKSKLRFRTSGMKTKDGGRPGKVDFDEYHAYETVKLVNTSTTGLGKKAHPRRTIITTNGDIRGGPLDDLISKSAQILSGIIHDNGTFPFICKLDTEDEITDKTKWDKANPSLRFFPILQHELDSEFGDYLQNPVGEADFATKRMNMPQGSKDVEVTTWTNILATNQGFPDLTNCACIAGIDYAKTTDMVCAGLLFLFKGIYYWYSHTWVCSRSSDLGRIKAPLREWEKLGLLTFVDAPEISPDIPALWLQEQGQRYNILTLCIDNYRHTLLARALREVGFDTDKHGLNNIKLIRPSDQMKMAPTINSLFVNHLIGCGNNPAFRWATNNACLITSPAGNITYGKIESHGRKTDTFMGFVAAMCGSENLEDSGDVTEINFGNYSY